MIIILGTSLVSLGALFLPPLYVSSKRGMVQGGITFFLTIFFLIAMTVMLAIAWQVLFPPVIYY